MRVSDDQAAFTQIHLLFLERSTYLFYLDYRLPDENSNGIIPKKCLQPLNKCISIYYTKTSKIYPDLNPTAPLEPQTHRSKKIN